MILALNSILILESTARQGTGGAGGGDGNGQRLLHGGNGDFGRGGGGSILDRVTSRVIAWPKGGGGIGNSG